jgi:3-methyladenine DNA glycosylase AlkD
MKESNIIKSLYALQDAAYRDFNSKLIPNISPDLFIGVRTFVLKKMAKDMLRSGLADSFISNLPHKYFEENQLHAFILSEISDFDKALNEIDRFLPYINNWATCDQLSPRAFKKNSDQLYKHICKWIKTGDVYSIRFGILCLMRYFMDDKFDKKYADMVASVKSKEYYVNMMRAWYFATGAAKQFEKFLPYFKPGQIDEWTRLRAIQKALESYRVSPENKEILRSMR